MYKEKFQNILSENEEVVRIERTKKTTVVLKKIVSIIIAICVICGMFYYVDLVTRLWDFNSNPIWKIYMGIGVAIIILLDFILSLKTYSNYFICLTNKRIIIRYGTFTNNYKQYSIENVTGNIQTTCKQSIWDKKNSKDASSSIGIEIELLPVGHDKIYISTSYSIENGYEMAKEIEKVVKANAKLTEKIIME